MQYVVIITESEGDEFCSGPYSWQEACRLQDSFEKQGSDSHIYKLVDPVTGKDKNSV